MEKGKNSQTISDSIRQWLATGPQFENVKDGLEKFIKETGIQTRYQVFRFIYLEKSEAKSLTSMPGYERATAISEETIEKRLSPKGTPYAAWIKNDNMATHLDTGKEVVIAGFVGATNGTILKHHLMGEKEWPDSDGFTVLESGSGIKRYLTVDQIKVLKK